VSGRERQIIAQLAQSYAFHYVFIQRR